MPATTSANRPGHDCPAQYSLSWINRDARLITAARGTRTFSQSFISVIMAIYLAELGFNLVQIGRSLPWGLPEFHSLHLWWD